MTDDASLSKAGEARRGIVTPPACADGQFVELLTKNQVRLRSYVFALVRDAADADDVMQEACIALWKMRDDYDPTRDYFRWACGIALIESLRFRRKRAADKLLFDEALLTTLAAEYLEHSETWEQRRAALRGCLRKLDEKDRGLLEARYRSSNSIATIANERGRPQSTIYSSLTRIRETLYRCVQITIAQQSHK